MDARDYRDLVGRINDVRRQCERRMDKAERQGFSNFWFFCGLHLVTFAFGVMVALIAMS